MLHPRKNVGTSASALAPIPSTILTVDQVAAHLSITKAAVYELTRFRQSTSIPRLPARKVGKSLRFSLAEVEAWFLSLPKHKHLQKRQYIKDEPRPVRLRSKSVRAVAA